MIKPLQRDKRKSIGSELFLYILAGALLGLGGISYFFYQALEALAKDEIRGNLSTQVKLVDNGYGVWAATFWDS